MLYAFSGGSDGWSPAVGLLADGEGNLYGATNYGGDDSNGGLGYGTVFKIAPDGSKSLLYAFTGESNGDEPRGTLARDDEGNLYGTTHYGGEANSSCLTGCGTVFKITPDGQQSVLHIFGGVPVGDGGGPTSGLVADGKGNFYGTTFAGGKIFGGSAPCYTFGCGTVFKMTPDGEVTVLHAFEGGSDGAWPTANLIADAEGNLYGTTNAGGGDGCVVGCGTVYKLTPAGTLSVLHSFGDGSEGTMPGGQLVADPQSNLYGTAADGGAYGGGTVFKLTPAGALSVLYDFRAFRGDAETPVGHLIIDRRGNLFGTSFVGGASHKGTIFKVQN